ncbi:M28 family peptidase [Candidatus Riflebacteria bacterium]
MMNCVELLEGKSNRERRNIIIELLEQKGFPYKTEKYFLNRDNIIITLGEAGKEILIVTHYDAVLFSPGANDNASTIAVIFDVLEKLKVYKPENKLRFIIFGDEEFGCLGSYAYVRKHGVKNILAVYNMELVGMGDMIAVWPITKEVKAGRAVTVLENTITKLGYYFEEAGHLPGFYGDYKPFREYGCSESICITVIPTEQKDQIREFAESSVFLLPFRLFLGIKRPRFFEHYHSRKDQSKYLNESALEMTSEIIYQTVISIDKGIESSSKEKTPV